MIEKLQNYTVLNSKTDVLKFHSQGMNISLVVMLKRDGKKSLTVIVEGAGAVELTTAGPMGTWTTSKVDLDRSVVHVSTTSAGAAPSATESSTTESHK